ncbi:MAG TPA: hypothetical protein VGW78_01360 [Candidatus Babeliales bacterium]|jgi:hypothetical protein|nr:hypothetical protein [Candidatus Babeliales bacterium]
MFHQIINNKYAMRWLFIILICITSINTQTIQWPTIWSGQNNKTILCSFGVLLAGMGIGGFIVHFIGNIRLKAKDDMWTQKYTKLLNERDFLEQRNNKLQEEADECFSKHLSLEEQQQITKRQVATMEKIQKILNKPMNNNT